MPRVLKCDLDSVDTESVERWFDTIGTGEIDAEEVSFAKMQLVDSAIGQVVPVALRRCPRLSRLDLSHNHLTNRGCVVLAECIEGMRKRHEGAAALRSLSVAHNQIGVVGAEVLSMAYIPSSSSGDYRLALSGNPLGDDGASALALAIQCRQTSVAVELRETGLGAACTSLTRCMPWVSELDISRNAGIPSESLSVLLGALGPSLRCAGLTHLSAFTAPVAQSMANALTRCPKLSVLCLAGNNLLDAGLNRLTSAMASQPAQFLEELDLCGNRLSDGNMLAQILVGGAPRLVSLSLANNEFNDMALVAISAGFSMSSQLQRLNLAHNRFGSAGTVALAHALEQHGDFDAEHPVQFQAPAVAEWLQGLCDDVPDFCFRGTPALGLEVLDLSHNLISDEGADALAWAARSSPNLRLLAVQDCGIGVAGHLSLEQAVVASHSRVETFVGTAHAILHGTTLPDSAASFHVLPQALRVLGLGAESLPDAFVKRAKEWAAAASEDPVFPSGTSQGGGPKGLAEAALARAQRALMARPSTVSSVGSLQLDSGRTGSQNFTPRDVDVEDFCEPSETVTRELCRTPSADGQSETASPPPKNQAPSEDSPCKDLGHLSDELESGPEQLPRGFDSPDKTALASQASDAMARAEMVLSRARIALMRVQGMEVAPVHGESRWPAAAHDATIDAADQQDPAGPQSIKRLSRDVAEIGADILRLETSMTVLNGESGSRFNDVPNVPRWAPVQNSQVPIAALPPQPSKTRSSSSSSEAEVSSPHPATQPATVSHPVSVRTNRVTFTPLVENHGASSVPSPLSPRMLQSSSAGAITSSRRVASGEDEFQVVRDAKDGEELQLGHYLRSRSGVLPAARGKGTAPPLPSGKGLSGRPSICAPPLLTKCKSMGMMRRNSLPSPETEAAPFHKKLFWKPVDIGNVEGTIFHSKDGPRKTGVFDVDALKRMFAEEKAKSTERVRRSTTLLLNAQQKNLGLKILSDHRARNIAIILKRLPLSATQLGQVLQDLQWEATVLGSDDLEQILEVIPTQEEAEQLCLHRAPEARQCLRDVEQSVMPLALIKRGMARVRMLVIARTARSQSRQTGRSLKIIRDACSAIVRSAMLREVLLLALDLGNFINHGDSSKGAKAIAIGSLVALKDFKAGRMSSLHFLIACLLMGDPDRDAASVLARDMKPVVAAAALQISTVQAGVRTCKRNLEVVELECRCNLHEYRVGSGEKTPPPKSRRKLSMDTDSSDTDSTDSSPEENDGDAEVASPEPEENLDDFDPDEATRFCEDIMKIRERSPAKRMLCMRHILKRLTGVTNLDVEQTSQQAHATLRFCGAASSRPPSPHELPVELEALFQQLAEFVKVFTFHYTEVWADLPAYEKLFTEGPQGNAEDLGMAGA